MGRRMISENLRMNDGREPEKKKDNQGPEKKKWLQQNWPLIALLILSPILGFLTYVLVILVGRTDAVASYVASQVGNVTPSEIGQLMRQLPLDVWYCAFGIGFWGVLVIVGICIIVLKKKGMLT